MIILGKSTYMTHICSPVVLSSKLVMMLGDHLIWFQPEMVKAYLTWMFKEWRGWFADVDRSSRYVIVALGLSEKNLQKINVRNSDSVPLMLESIGCPKYSGFRGYKRERNISGTSIGCHKVNFVIYQVEHQYEFPVEASPTLVYLK